MSCCVWYKFTQRVSIISRKKFVNITALSLWWSTFETHLSRETPSLFCDCFLCMNFSNMPETYVESTLCKGYFFLIWNVLVYLYVLFSRCHIYTVSIRICEGAETSDMICLIVFQKWTWFLVCLVFSGSSWGIQNSPVTGTIVCCLLDRPGMKLGTMFFASDRRGIKSCFYLPHTTCPNMSSQKSPLLK